MRKSSWLLILIFILAVPAHGLVNMKNANFSDKWIDIIVPGKGYDFKIERYYSSRSLFIGVFGFGWCSSLETSLNITSVGEIILTECGGGIEVVYYPEKFDPVSVSSTIDAIVKNKKARAKIAGTRLSPEDIKGLRSRLSKDHFERFELAKKYHIINVNDLRKRKNIFVSKNSRLDRIDYDGTHYSRAQKSGRTERFNTKGKLVQVLDRASNWIKIHYKGSRIQHIVDNIGRQLVFKYNKSNNQLKSITGAQGLSMTYVFENENLVQVTNAWRNTYYYKYDTRHNLTQVDFPGGTSIKMTYDNTNDWIKSYTDRRGCKEIYNFITSTDDKRNHYWSTVSKSCRGINISGRFEFWFKAHKDGSGKYLERAKSDIDGKLDDTYYHPYYGSPISITKNNSLEKRTYYKNGLLKQREFKGFDKSKRVSEWFTVFMKYNTKLRKVNEAIKTMFNAKGSKIREVSTTFEYTKKGLLTKAKKGKGPAVTVSYDAVGRIHYLEDSKKNKLELIYSPNFDKPEIIRQSKVGQIRIQYDPAGDIVSVTSPKGRNIATSVVESFIKFIDIIGPAAEELSI